MFPNDFFKFFQNYYPANIYLFKVNNRNTRKRTTSGIFIINFEHTSHLFLVFLLLTLNK